MGKESSYNLGALFLYIKVASALKFLVQKPWFCVLDSKLNLS